MVRTSASQLYMYAAAASGDDARVRGLLAVLRVGVNIRVDKKTVRVELRVAGVDRKGRDKMTPLAVAAMRGHSRIVGMLLAAKASKAAVNEDGDTPLCLAARGKTTNPCALY